mgnify:CR=1 FL=1
MRPKFCGLYVRVSHLEVLFELVAHEDADVRQDGVAAGVGAARAARLRSGQTAPEVSGA